MCRIHFWWSRAMKVAFIFRVSHIRRNYRGKWESDFFTATSTSRDYQKWNLRINYGQKQCCPGFYHLIRAELLLVVVCLHRHRNAVIAALGPPVRGPQVGLADQDYAAAGYEKRSIVHSNCLGGGVSGFWRLGSVMHAYHHFESWLSSAGRWFDKNWSCMCVAMPIIWLIFFGKRGGKERGDGECTIVHSKWNRL